MIIFKNLTLRRGVKVVLQGASAAINPGEKVGLVGRNGAGKTSLFALLTGDLHADAGEFDMPPGWLLPGGISQVAQSMPETDDSATDFVMAGDARLLAAQQALAVAEEGHDGMAIAHAHQALDEAGAFTARSRAQALCLGLGFKPEELEQAVNSFSGGWRMRLQLARALMCPAQLMLLDEPTNHLDLDALVWLEGFLARFAGTMLVISHDREFLDAVTKVTLHLEEASLTRYAGNYSKFEEMKAERERLQQASHSRQQERIAHLTRFVERFKAKASKARQAQSRVKALERMERIPPVLSAASFDFEFREPLTVPNPMLAVSHLSCGYAVEAGSKAILSGLNRSIMAGQRIGLLGANGQGKSTLVKTIAQVLPPLAGVYTQGKGLSIGYFAQQELDVLRAADSPLQHLTRLARELGPPAREQELRNFLGSFRFSNEMAAQAVGTLSGGEKARLVLAMLVWQRPNLLLLDEPTNHLDLVTREALAMALNSFEGALLLVSHDRALLRTVCDEFWLVTDGRIESFDGDLDDYQRWLLDRAKDGQKAAQKAQREATQGMRNPAGRQKAGAKA
ncbi:MAG TPA: ATP-binding cassette domain-containing protein [Lautropia sp.]|nr:ATP-binding cassette domain-containing protein [Lautropia sp.]